MSSSKRVIFFDIDNTLYSASTGISAAMGKRIHEYFRSLGLDEAEASDLHHDYYTKYGLALRGLILHHHVDPLDFDAKCDGSLPLEEFISPNPKLRKLFEDIDRTKCTHASRVLRILDLEDQIDGGVIFCDYAQPNFACKPDPQFYHQALAKASVSDLSLCYFIDDNRGNVDAARALNWGHVAHFWEKGLVHVEGGKVKEIGRERIENADNGAVIVTDLEELRIVWPEIFTNGD
ncbi:unnamed protein product [Mycena citricolor]|uniref:Pyrimidine 5-nucleotidase n=1 Tax=Mycena citricolor TaxID=2018698 RepID=A0AAD2Q4K0_9AGAR|nr:unnamed protein product [Mycena citricolor]